MSSENFITSAIGQIPVQEYVATAKDFMNNITAYTVSYDQTHNYQISLLAKYLHQVPRFDLDLRHVNNSFDPYSANYLESLGIWVSLPGFWLILTLLLFLIFFICRCCAISNRKAKDVDSLDGSLSQEKSHSPTSNCCSRLYLFVLAIITTSFIAIGLYGCLQMQIGMFQVQSSLYNISRTVGSCRNRTSIMQSSMNSIMRDSLGQLVEMSNRQYMAQHSRIFTDYLRSANESQRIIMGRLNELELELYTAGLGNTERTLSTIEDYRRPLSVVLIAVLMFINMILIYGVCCNSRAFLLMYDVLGLVAIIVCWLACSLYLGLAIVTSDFCHSPQPFFVSPHSRAPQEIFDQYLYCQTTPEIPLFQKRAQRPISAVRELEDIFKLEAERTNSLHQYCSKEACGAGQLIAPIHEIISKALMNLTFVRNQLSCNPLHSYYTDGMTGLCKTTFEGAFLMLIVMTFGGLLFTLLVLSSSQLWLAIRKRRQATTKSDAFTDEVDLSQAFLPGTGSSTASSRRNNLSMSHYGMMPSASRPR
ncbi:Protein tweety-like 2, partial [Fragariocoptes setiger]